MNRLLEQLVTRVAFLAKVPIGYLLNTDCCLASDLQLYVILRPERGQKHLQTVRQIAGYGIQGVHAAGGKHHVITQEQKNKRRSFCMGVKLANTDDETYAEGV